MTENSKKLNAVEVKEFSDVLEKTLLEISILDSLYGSNTISDHVKNVFRSSIDDLRNFGTLKTIAGIVLNDDKYKENQKKEERELQECSNDGRFTLQEFMSLEKEIQILKLQEEDIDSIIEKQTKEGEHTAIRRETEKNYVVKWEKARVEQFKMTCKAEELRLKTKMAELQAKLETAKIVNAENENFLNHSIKDLEKQIKHWECKYKTDVNEIDEKLENLMITLKEKTEEVEKLKNIYNERRSVIEEHAKNKKKLEEEKKINDYREKMATKIQAWWRGTMVRRRLGAYKHLLGPRKKSIKKPTINKGKKSTK